MKHTLADIKIIIMKEARALREVDLSSGEKTTFGSNEHIKDLERRIRDLTFWRDKSVRGSAKRANYARVVQELKADLRAAQRAAAKKES